jgi:glycopeptide antibiotics resistance protein
MAWLAGFVGGALLWALGLTALGAGSLRLAGRRLWASARGRAGIVFAFLVLFFLALALHPFPDRATLACPVPGTEPRLVPFRFAWRMAELAARPAQIPAIVTRIGFGSAVMNFLICAAIGAALARWTRRGAGAAVLFGATLTLGVEFTQLTGLWGLYPCAYRLFDVDDLVLNLAGVVAGFVLARRIARGPLPAPPGSSGTV